MAGAQSILFHDLIQLPKILECIRKIGEQFMLLLKATITSKGQITIPKRIRDFLNLSPGDQIDFVIGSHGEERDIRTLKGLLHKPGQHLVTIEEMNKAIRKRARSVKRNYDSRK